MVERAPSYRPPLHAWVVSPPTTNHPPQGNECRHLQRNKTSLATTNEPFSLQTPMLEINVGQETGAAPPPKKSQSPRRVSISNATTLSKTSGRDTNSPSYSYMHTTAATARPRRTEPADSSKANNQNPGAAAALPASDGCTGSGTSTVGAMDRGWASMTYATPSSDAYDGGRGAPRGREGPSSPDVLVSLSSSDEARARDISCCSSGTAGTSVFLSQ